MTHYPEKYKQICENFVREYFAAHKRQIENNFQTQIPGGGMQGLVFFERPLETALGGKVVEIARAAAGELGQDELGIVAEMINGLLEDLFTPPGLDFRPHLLDGCAQSQLARSVAHSFQRRHARARRRTYPHGAGRARAPARAGESQLVRRICRFDHDRVGVYHSHGRTGRLWAAVGREQRFCFER